MKLYDIKNVKEKYWYIFPITDYINNYKNTTEYKIKYSKLIKKEKKERNGKKNKKEKKANLSQIIDLKNDKLIEKDPTDNDNEIFNLLDEIIKKNKKD